MQRWFLIFCILIIKKNTFQVLACLLILDILQEAASEFPSLVAPQRKLETSIQPLKKPTANHLPVILKRNTETSFNFF
jgi:hypothetical protein